MEIIIKREGAVKGVKKGEKIKVDDKLGKDLIACGDAEATSEKK